MKSKLSLILVMSMLVIGLAVTVSPMEVAASNQIDAFKKAQEQDRDTSLETDGLFASMNSIVYLILGAGGIWVILCLAFAGFKLAAAQGGNPQARTQALIGIACAFAGGLVMVKVYDIAGWIWSMGGQGV